MKKNNRELKELAKRGLAIVLCCLCLLATVPVSAMAQETAPTAAQEETPAAGGEQMENPQGGTGEESPQPLTEEIPEGKTVPTTQNVTPITTETTTTPNTETTTTPNTETTTTPSTETTTTPNTETTTTPNTETVTPPTDTIINKETETDTKTEEVTFYDQLMAAQNCEIIFNLLNENPMGAYALTDDEVNALYVHVETLEDDECKEEVCYTLEYLLTVDENGATVTYAWPSDSSSSTIHYWHFDFRIAASITVKVYNADGTVTETTVDGTVSEPTAVIYNTSGETWENYDGTNSDGVKYKNVTFDDKTSADSGGELEYQSTLGHSRGSDLEFYEGDTLALTYKLTYTLNGQTHTVPLTQTVVTDNDDNVCSKKDSTGDMRGFDIVVSAEDISSAMNTSVMQISKVWNDNNQSEIRPDSIIVNIAQDGNTYLTLTLKNDASGSSWSMASGLTAPDGLTVTFSDGYGATINGLPQNTWDFSGGTPTYVSHTYTVTEVSQVAKEGLKITPVYGSDISYSPDADKYEYQVYLTNTLAYETLAVQKVWDDSDSTTTHTDDSVTVKLSATYSGGTVPDKWLADFLGTTTFTLNSANNWYIKMGQMPVYYTKSSDEVYQITGFQITETSATIGGTTYTCDDSDVGESGYTWSASAISTGKDDNGNYYITVTNSNAPQTTSVTIDKVVTGNMGDVNKNFTFTVKVNNVVVKTVTLNDGTPAVKIDNIPIDAEVTITESGNEGYEVSATLDKETTTVTDSAITFTTSKAEGHAIVFTNTKNVKIDTGVSLETLPYILILGVVAVGVVLMVRRRRHGYDD